MKKTITAPLILVLILLWGGVNICTGVDAPAKEEESPKQETVSRESDCRWEIKGIRPKNRKQKGQVNEFLAENPEWEPFGTTEGMVWVKRRVCE